MIRKKASHWIVQKNPKCLRLTFSIRKDFFDCGWFSPVPHSFKLILFLPSLIFFVSCTSLTPKEKLKKASEETSKKLEEIKRHYNKSEYEQVINKTLPLIGEHRGTDIGDTALFLLAKTYSHRENWKEALKSFEKIYNSNYQSPREGYSRVTASKILTYKIKDYEKALQLIDQSLKTEIDNQQRTELLEARFKSLLNTGSQLEAFETLVELSEKHPMKSRRESFRKKAQDFIDSRLSGPELMTFANDNPNSPLKINAMYRYGIHLMNEGHDSAARSYLKRVIREQPKSFISHQAKKILDQMNNRDQVNPRTIGVVIPLSGRYSKMGYECLRGLQLAFGIKGGKNRENFRLAIIDSRGKPEYVRKGIKRLVDEDHVIAIIGGFLSKTAYYGAIQSHELGVPFIALSQKEGLTDIGPFIFRNALTIESQIDKLLDSAINKLDLKQFAILYPNDSYGVKVSNIFWKKVKENGGVVTGVQTYSPGETDFNESVKKLVGTFYLEDRKREYKQRLRKWYQTSKKRKSPPSGLLPPIVDFQAIFIPDGIKAFGQIAPTLAYNDVNDILFMGTNIWNSRELLKRGKSFANQSLFTDSFFSQETKFIQSGFYKNYLEVFNSIPSGFSLLGYDSGLIVRSAINQSAKTRLDLGRQIQKNHKIPGGLNTLVLNKKREFIRPVTLLTAKDGEIVPFTSQ